MFTTIEELGTALRSVSHVTEQEVIFWQVAARESFEITPQIQKMGCKAVQARRDTSVCIQSLRDWGQTLYREESILDALYLRYDWRGSDHEMIRVRDLTNAWIGFRKALQIAVFRLKLILRPHQENGDLYSAWREEWDRKREDREGRIRLAMEGLVKADDALNRAEIDKDLSRRDSATLNLGRLMVDMVVDTVGQNDARSDLPLLDNLVSSWYMALPPLDIEREAQPSAIAAFSKGREAMEAESAACWRRLHSAPDMFRSRRDVELISDLIGSEERIWPLVTIQAGEAARPLQIAFQIADTAKQELQHAIDEEKANTKPRRRRPQESLSSVPKSQLPQQAIDEDKPKTRPRKRKPEGSLPPFSMTWFLKANRDVTLESFREAKKTAVNTICSKQSRHTHNAVNDMRETASWLLHGVPPSVKTYEGMSTGTNVAGDLAPAQLDRIMTATAFLDGAARLARRLPWLTECRTSKDLAVEGTAASQNTAHQTEGESARSVDPPKNPTAHTVSLEVANELKSYIASHEDVEKTFPKPLDWCFDDALQMGDLCISFQELNFEPPRQTDPNFSYEPNENLPDFSSVPRTPERLRRQQELYAEANFGQSAPSAAGDLDSAQTLNSILVDAAQPIKDPSLKDLLQQAIESSNLAELIQTSQDDLSRNSSSKTSLR